MKLCTRFFLLALLLSLCLTLPLAAKGSRVLVGDPLESGALILSPAEDGWLYGASPEMDGSADGVAQWFSPADGSVVLTGLQPEGVYQLYRKQADPDGEGQVSPPEALLLFAAPVAPPAAEDFRRLVEVIRETKY